ncbi:OB-fold domain-containing protein [Leucobacter weissii]|uniref:OB-fold domain-containing protein n=1 Tax=Leucobacter weissii TaxID=1983706 RepID=A0A939MMY4_9MICO|nr:OB-fold domain-containing protein [Leucobacter weissii]MBO1901416.1 OB-fold domain-containing protein [Leucobacter weissii]
MTMQETRPGAETMESFATQIHMPYTLTPGQAVGVFLAELAQRRLIGSRHGDRVLFPAQDFSGESGEPGEGFVEVPPVGTVASFTTVEGRTLALIQLDGTASSFVHRLVGLGGDEVEIGQRVEAVWSDRPSGTILDLLGFGPVGTAETFVPRDPAEDLAAPFEQVEYTMTLDFEHSYGHYYGSLFDGVKHDRRVRGVKCSSCRKVLLPPRERCDVCFAPTLEWVDVEAVGTIQASSVVHVEFVGQRVKPPYVYAEIVLDGTSTRLIHTVGGLDPHEARTKAGPGARVRAVWSERRTGSLADIDYFEVIDDELGQS